jgi:hypothetical protein
MNWENKKIRLQEVSVADVIFWEKIYGQVPIRLNENVS